MKRKKPSCEKKEAKSSRDPPSLASMEAELAKLHSEQKRAVSLVMSKRRNVFLTGDAGTGKSRVLNFLGRFADGPVCRTGSTGPAAVDMGGSTLHHLCGIRVGDPNVQTVVARFKQTAMRRAATKLRRARLLLVDEVSQLHTQTLEWADTILRAVRKDDRPLGGLLVVLCGDFCQLPSVVSKDETRTPLFERRIWASLGLTTVHLTQVFRQTEPELLSLLSGVRYGVCSPAHMQLVRQRAALVPDNILSRTHLYGRRQDAHKENEAYLSGLPGTAYTYRSRDDTDRGSKETVFAHCPAEERLRLKVGAAVVLLRNLDVSRGLANGSQGVVLRFVSRRRPSDVNEVAEGEVEQDADDDIFPWVRFTCGVERLMVPEAFEIRRDGEWLGTRRQVPLLLAHALTVHRAQGMSLDRVEVHVDSLWDEGHLYTAMSRVRLLEGLFLAGFSDATWKKSLVTSASVRAFYQT